jgi:lipopolysaccharide transport system permease protein
MASFSFGTSLSLWRALVRQELANRYRGTLLGWVWPLLMPLVLLGVYGFVFGTVFKSRWPGQAESESAGFALYLLAGLLVHGLLAEAVAGAPGVLLRQANFVRKVVFPLPVLPAVPLGVGLVHSAVGLALLTVVGGLLGHGPHASALALPLVLLPFLALIWGLALLLAALGVYLRDLQQVSGVLVMLMLFVGPVFFPASLVPEGWAWLLALNPISWPVETVRGALLEGHWPSPAGLAAYTLSASAVLGLGWLAFAKLRRGFADVL